MCDLGMPCGEKGCPWEPKDGWPKSKDEGGFSNMLSNLRDNGEPISIKITEGKNGTFYYGVFYGDGAVAGCLCAAAGGYSSASFAFHDALRDYFKQTEIRDCEHKWAPKYGKRHCVKCGVFDWDWEGEF